MNKEQLEQLQARLLMQSIKCRAIVKTLETIDEDDDLAWRMRHANDHIMSALQIADQRLYDLENA